ncbi:unnamed protein product [Chironomus riparius]|uniref:Uncharacterized protein n=1 Tax=Chironomus riparius TaxID=315576 RepID=A0A9N9RRY7_9DIPT|nr:unnamed protein product [Chironomus riparius]
MIFTGNNAKRRYQKDNGQSNSQRRKNTNSEGRNRIPSAQRMPRENSRDSICSSSYLLSHSSSLSPSASSNYYSTPRSSNSSSYMTIPELEEPKHDFYVQKTRARDITKRRGAIKLIQRLT